MSHRGSHWRIFIGVILLQWAALLALCPPTFAQGLLWAKRSGGTGSDQGTSIAVDSTGNAYITGSFSSPATFGLGEASQTVLTSAGAGNMFLAKYDANGSLVWAKAAGGTGAAFGSGIALDSTGNIYVTGSFSGMVVFGPGEANAVTLTAVNISDIFIARFANDGSLVWVKGASSPSTMHSAGISVDGAGNSLVTGNFSNGATFGAGEANETTFSSSALFIAKYDSGGVLSWARHAPGAWGTAIALDTSGNIYVTGSGGTATFGPGETNQTVLALLGSNDCFFAKFNSNGALSWVTQVGGSTNGDVCTGYGLAVDASGAIYATGLFTGTVTFGSAEMNQMILTGGADVFIAKYHGDGTLTWAKRAGGGMNDQGNGIALDSSGGIYVTGLTHFFATFGAGDPTQTQITSAGSADAFVAKYNNAGTLVWVKRGGGTGYDDVRGLAVSSMGVTYVTGRISGNAIFGSGEINQTVLTSSGNTDIFVAKLVADDLLREAIVDFDDDGKSDIGIFRGGDWFIRRSSDGQVAAVNLGSPGATPVPADYDGDGIADAATYENGVWAIRRSSDGVLHSATHGGASFIAVPQDYDGDGKADIAVYLDGVWSILGSLDNVNTVIAHGGPGWIPLPGDYDGDGKVDIAVYHPNGAWSVRWSSINQTVVTGHGGPSWEPVPGDYDGDGRMDLAVYSNGAWSIVRSSDNSISVVGHGGPDWTPVSADYDGDGKTDIAVYHPVGAWSIIRSSAGTIDVVAHGGGPADVPLN